MKTLAVILNHNGPELTDQLYRSLEPYKSDIYDVHVLDNGSTTEGKSKYTTLEAEYNCYYGGALNLMMTYFKENKEYDSMFILNNDIMLHGYNFVKTMRRLMFDGDYTVLSPSIIQPEETQCYWRQMHNYNSEKVRDVKWVDFCCPMFSRKLLDVVDQFSNDLFLGWGQDVYTGMICDDHNLKIGVADICSTIHLSKQTYKDGKSDLTVDEYSKKAGQQMFGYMNSIGQSAKFQSFRRWGETYRYE